MEDLSQLLERNAQWAASMVADDPEFFRRLAQQQSPKFLWIGCSDSRVPANQILALQPGEIFVHRNLANMAPAHDTNCQAVLEFAVAALKVEHIMVVGHYRCSAVHAALHGAAVGEHSERWLNNLQEVARKHVGLLASEPAIHRREAMLCEINVLEQTSNVCSSAVVQAAWARGQDLSVHGWIYRLADGRLRHLDLSASRGTDLGEMQRRALERIVSKRRIYYADR